MNEISDLFFEVEETEKVEEEENYDHPHGSEWVIGVDHKGLVFIVDTPDIHPGFLEYDSAEEIGLPYEVDLAPGVYKVTCGYETHTDWETGIVDDYEFYFKDEPVPFYQVELEDLEEEEEETE